MLRAQLAAILLVQQPFLGLSLKDDLSVWSFGTNDHYARLVEFSFDLGGSYELELELTRVDGFAAVDDFFRAYNATSGQATGLWLAVCSDGELAAADKGVDCTAACRRLYRFESGRLQVADPGVAAAGYLNFVVMSCGFQSVEVRGKVAYTLLLSNGGHLGVNLAPLPCVYAVLVGLWSVVLAAWSANVWQYRRQNVLLQRGLSLVPCAKLLGVILRAYYFGRGHVTGELPQASLYFFYIVYVLYKGVFFAALLLVSKGWLITRPSLEESEKRNLIAVVMSFCALLLLHAYSTWFSSAYSLLALVAFHFYIRRSLLVKMRCL
eukprot:COSAG05_NODE_2582_length_2873_cov_305.547387_1_plen_322_part_00